MAMFTQRYKKRRVISESPIIEKGSYEQCKWQALNMVLLPRLGTVYRLLNDEYANPWTLFKIIDSHTTRSTSCDCLAGYFKPFPPDGVYSFEFSLIRPGSRGICFQDISRITCFMHEWPEKMRAGEIVVDGDDLPEGRLRNWATSKGIKYVLSRDMDRLMTYVAKATKDSWKTIEAYERSQEFNATRDGTRRLESVRRALNRRAISNRVGSDVHRQLRPKVP